MEAGSRGAARTKPLGLTSLAITIATVLAIASVPAFAQDPADGSVPPPSGGTPVPPPEALGDCATGGEGSTQGYADASPADAADLLTHAFPCIFDSLAADPPQDSGIALSL